MAERNWTKEQRQAIDAKGKLTVLSAAAGSGKTTVLVEKALRIILNEENKTSADELLIVTFSNASAKEFKNRIEKGLNDAVKKDPSNSYIKSQKIALQKADISTIHSFCIKLARENFQILGIPSDFTICDETKSFLIHQKAIDSAMEYGYSIDAFKKFASLFGRSSQDGQIREFLKYMYDYFSALPFPEERALLLAGKAQDTDLKNSPVYEFLWQNITQRAQYAKYLSDRQISLLDSGYADEYFDAVNERKHTADALIACCKNKDVSMLKIQSKPVYSRLKPKKDKNEISEAIKKLNDHIKKVTDGINADCVYLDEEVFKIHTEQAKDYINALTDVFIFYSQKLKEIKIKEKAFEFSDFEHFAVQLLLDENKNPTPLALSLRQKYVQIMEDEFQDTSYVQDMIFKTIAKEDEKNLFAVGDVKQSIYGFRKASPEIFLAKRDIGINNPQKANTIVLPHNFRSETGVINGVNRLFERIMTVDLGGVDYIAGEQLKAPDNKPKQPDTAVNLIICQDKDREIDMVCDKICSMVEKGEEIFENGAFRKVTYGDFCILLRNKTNFPKYAEALKARQVKSFIKDQSSIFEKDEIVNIVNLLKVINNPLLEVYLTAGMFGDLFGFTLDEILNLKTADRKENLYRLLSKSDDERCRGFLNTLKDFSFTAKILSPDKLISYITEKTGYYTALAFSENGEEKRENIRKFISLAKEYSLVYQNSLSDFIRYLDLCQISGKRMDAPEQKPSDAVAIMTMHTSKGLEFPVCFVSGLGTAFNKKDLSKRLMIDPDLGMAVYVNEKFGYNVSTAGIRAIKAKIEKANLNDEMRLLYVALTRAKSKLFLTAQYSNMFTHNTLQKIKEKNSSELNSTGLISANTPMEWILSGYINHPFFADGMLVKSDEKLAEFLSVSYFTYEEKQAKEQTQQISKSSINVSLAQKNFEYVYPDKEKTKLPIKVSVGRTAKANLGVNIPKPTFVKRENTALERGTQMHLFAQHCNIKNALDNIENEIERLDKKGIIDKNFINVKQAQRFINSPLCQMILNAQQVYFEKEFLVPYSAYEITGEEIYKDQSIMVQGVIDCLIINGDTAYIIDYKTDYVSSLDQLYEKYHKQLEMYEYAAKYLYDIKNTQKIIYSFRLGEYLAF